MRINKKFKRTAIALLLGVLGATTNVQAKSPNDSYLLVWSSDRGTDDGKQDPDFLAVVDANPHSPTYGKNVGAHKTRRKNIFTFCLRVNVNLF